MPPDEPSDTMTGLSCGMVPHEGSIAIVMSQLSPELSDAAPKKSADILTRPNLAWRCECLKKVGHIPSGYTYLAQLMGHDMGHSVPAGSVPHVEQASAAPDVAVTSVHPDNRYNLIRNPLTLETIYGAGPALLLHLYDPETLLFRLSPRAIQASVHWAGPAADGSPAALPVRALYDERNRDTLMLHELTVAWMQYHNLCALRLQQVGARPPMQAYAEARAHVVHVWHAILRNDLLPRFVHPLIAAMQMDELLSLWKLDEPSLLVGLFRAFHALPLAAYQFSGSGPHNLDELMKTDYLPSRAERAWEVGWDQFFGAIPGGPHTGISASVAAQLNTGARLVALMDLASAKEAGPLKAYQTTVMAMIGALPSGWPQQIAPAQLADRLKADHRQASPLLPKEDALATGPLYQFLMIEAQCHGNKGGFGPLGSALLRTSFEGSIARIEFAGDSSVLARFETPKTMLELINLVRRTTEWPQ